MTRKHFNAIAQALANARPGRSSSGYNAWYVVKVELGHALRAVAPKIDLPRFYQACDEWAPKPR